MNDAPDRLFELLPAVYRQRDVEFGSPLQALLRVIAEQVEVVEGDIDQLYDNWFIETCEDWVVPYLGALVGYRQVHEAGEPGDVSTAQGRLRNKILIPRREVANTIGYRRRRGTVALLEVLAAEVAGWPARAVEFFKLLGVAQALNHLRMGRGRTVDLRRGPTLYRIDGPFDVLAHTVDVRRPASGRTQGLHNIGSVGLFVWRLRPYSVTGTPAYCLEEVAPHCYTFSVLGNDAPLYVRPRREERPTQIAGELNLPIPIDRRAFEDRPHDYYGQDRSFEIFVGAPRQPVPLERLVAADLSDWQYRPRRGQVAVDPELGRMAFPPGELPKRGVWVRYHYALSADIGGGEYDRPISQPRGATFYRVGEGEEMRRLNDALERWRAERPADAVIEITDSGAYAEEIYLELEPNQSLQIRAANAKRPVIHLLDWRTELPDHLYATGTEGGCLVLDGLLVTGRGVQVEGGLVEVVIRHCTLVPGWGLRPDCEPRRPAEPSIELRNTGARLTVEHSIVGSIQVSQDEVTHDPLFVCLSNSIVDATSPEREALGAPSRQLAMAMLTVARCTVIGQVLTHAIELAENSIFLGMIRVARRQIGCIRFSYVEPGSRTPSRFNCQPDLVEKEAKAALGPAPSQTEVDAAVAPERVRVRPRLNSLRYGRPAYCQLAHSCAPEIKRGADDESEIGVFHDLFQPQRAANLRARLDEYTPAGMEAAIVFAT